MVNAVMIMFNCSIFVLPPLSVIRDSHFDPVSGFSLSKLQRVPFVTVRMRCCRGGTVFVLLWSS
jgi:hypothetical protein